MLLMRWCCWCTDAADPLMLLNQDQDLLADLCKAICSSLTNWRSGRWGIWRIWSATRRGRLSSPRWEWGRGWQLSWPAWSPLSHLQTPPGHYDNNLLFLVFRRMILHGSTWFPRDCPMPPFNFKGRLCDISILCSKTFRVLDVCEPWTNKWVC